MDLSDCLLYGPANKFNNFFLSRLIGRDNITRYCVFIDQDKVKIHNKAKKGLSPWPFLY